MLKALLRILSRDITGRTWQEESTHPYFGSIILFAFKTSSKSYWEAEIESEGRKLFVCIEVPGREIPNAKHVEFAKKVISNPDATFALVAPLLKREFEDWYDQSFPDNWEDAVKFTSFTIPANADERNEWDLCYESIVGTDGVQFTCNFVGGRQSMSQLIASHITNRCNGPVK